MKKASLFIFICGLLSFGLTAFFKTGKNPEKTILGAWKEMDWEYEKTDKFLANSTIGKTISDLEKTEIAKDLVIHEAETWTFEPNGNLKLKNGKTSKSVKWVLKGRGHILQLKHAKGDTENYQLTHLDDHRMVLNIELDNQARGIAKLVFSK
ncbi:MAG: hypothetical protein KAX81_03595 [Leadbetterella sp.]|jgi:hypothetical protein|nr:hypothetical protein [Leadbetterella sp.]MBP8156086.1 hypothetical protein [Leadbetterella sp.]